MDAAVGFPAAISKWLGLGKGTLWVDTGLVVAVWDPPREGRRGQGEDSQRWLVAGAWHGKDQGAGGCSLGWDRGDGYREDGE